MRGDCNWRFNCIIFFSNKVPHSSESLHLSCALLIRYLQLAREAFAVCHV